MKEYKPDLFLFDELPKELRLFLKDSPFSFDDGAIRKIYSMYYYQNTPIDVIKQRLEVIANQERKRLKLETKLWQ